jgi:hypothetical protein
MRAGAAGGFKGISLLTLGDARCKQQADQKQCLEARGFITLQMTLQ